MIKNYSNKVPVFRNRNHSPKLNKRNNQIIGQKSQSKREPRKMLGECLKASKILTISKLLTVIGTRRWSFIKLIKSAFYHLSR